MVAILVLGLITIFLFKEGAGFVQLYHKSLKEYQRASNSTTDYHGVLESTIESIKEY